MSLRQYSSYFFGFPFLDLNRRRLVTFLVLLES
jgi:hypothetical protein